MVTEAVKKKTRPAPEAEWVQDEKSKLETFWQPQKKRMAEDQALYEMFRLEPEEGESNVILNDLRVQVNKVCRMIASAEWRAVFDPEGTGADGEVDFGLGEKIDQAQRDDAATLKEKIITWVWSEADVRWRQGLNTGLSATMLKHLTARGMVATRVKIDADYDTESSSIEGDDTFPFEIAPIDPINVYPRIRGRKIAHILHVYKTEWGEIAAEWGVEDATKKDDDEVEVIVYYDDTWWGVMVDGDWVKEPEEHGYGFCPLVVDVAEGGEFRTGPNMTGTEYVKHIGTPLIEDMRQNYLDRNRAATMRDELLAYAINPARIEETEDGKVEDLDTRTGAINTRKAGRSYNIRPVPTLDGLAAGDLAKLESDYDQRVSWAGMPRVTFGEIPGPIAGYAISNLTKGAKDVLTSWIDSFKGHTMRINRCVLKLIANPDVGVGQLDIRGQTNKLGAFRQIVSPEAIGHNFAHTIEMGEVLPADMPGLIDMGNRATGGPNPLFSTHTWREKFGQNIVGDNRAEFQKILEERAAMQAAMQSISQNIAYGVMALKGLLGEDGMNQLMGPAKQAAFNVEQQQTAAPPDTMPETLPQGEATGAAPVGMNEAQTPTPGGPGTLPADLAALISGGNAPQGLR